MTETLTAAQAFDLYAEARAADRLTQNAWYRMESDGRRLACGLGVLGPNINGPRDCPASVMPRWLAQMVPWFFDGMAFADAKEWGLRFYAELKRLDGDVPFSVVHDWQVNAVVPLGIECRTLKGKPTDAAVKLQALHLRAMSGDVAPRTEWFEALQPALRESYAYAYADAYAYGYANAYANAYADADADAYANANDDAYADAYANANAYADAKQSRRQEAIKRLADGMVDALSRVRAA